MESYLFVFDSGQKAYHNVVDKLDFFELLKHTRDFTELYKFDVVNEEWQEVIH